MRFQRALTAIATVFTVPVLTVTTSGEPAQAASACDSFSRVFYYYDEVETHIPSVGYDTKNFKCTLQRGNQGVAVKALQELLRCRWDDSLTVDGLFGTLTEATLRDYQAYLKISVDGVYGPQTGETVKWPFYLPKDGSLHC